jgi:hypothetical protein
VTSGRLAGRAVPAGGAGSEPAIAVSHLRKTYGTSQGNGTTSGSAQPALARGEASAREL